MAQLNVRVVVNNFTFLIYNPPNFLMYAPVPDFCAIVYAMHTRVAVDLDNRSPEREKPKILVAAEMQ